MFTPTNWPSTVFQLLGTGSERGTIEDLWEGRSVALDENCSEILLLLGSHWLPLLEFLLALFCY